MGHTGFEHIDPSGPDGFDSDPDFRGGGSNQFDPPGSINNGQDISSGGPGSPRGGITAGDFAPIAGQAIGSAISFGASVFSGKQNADLAKGNQKFQEEMSKTQYQRAVIDMKLAGLNPMLAYTQGGAGNLSGSMAQVPDAGAAVAQGAQAGAAGARASMEKSRQRSQIALLDAGTRASNAQAVKAEWEGKMVATGYPAAHAREIWDMSKEGRQWNRDRHRNTMGMEIISNAPGAAAGHTQEVSRGLEDWLTNIFGETKKSPRQHLDTGFDYINRPNKKRGRDY